LALKHQIGQNPANQRNELEPPTCREERDVAVADTDGRRECIEDEHVIDDIRLEAGPRKVWPVIDTEAMVADEFRRDRQVVLRGRDLPLPGVGDHVRRVVDRNPGEVCRLLDCNPVSTVLASSRPLAAAIQAADTSFFAASSCTH
jgi:hypothetical protein